MASSLTLKHLLKYEKSSIDLNIQSYKLYYILSNSYEDNIKYIMNLTINQLISSNITIDTNLIISNIKQNIMNIIDNIEVCNKVALVYKFDIYTIPNLINLLMNECHYEQTIKNVILYTSVVCASFNKYKHNLKLTEKIGQNKYLSFIAYTAIKSLYNISIPTTLNFESLNYSIKYNIEDIIFKKDLPNISNILKNKIVNLYELKYLILLSNIYEREIPNETISIEHLYKCDDSIISSQGCFVRILAYLISNSRANNDLIYIIGCMDGVANNYKELIKITNTDRNNKINKTKFHQASYELCDMLILFTNTLHTTQSKNTQLINMFNTFLTNLNIILSTILINSIYSESICIYLFGNKQYTHNNKPIKNVLLDIVNDIIEYLDKANSK